MEILLVVTVAAIAIALIYFDKNQCKFLGHNYAVKAIFSDKIWCSRCGKGKTK